MVVEIEPGSDEELEWRGLWLSRLMFGGLVTPELQPFTEEHRSYDDFLLAHGLRLA